MIWTAEMAAADVIDAQYSEVQIVVIGEPALVGFTVVSATKPAVSNVSGQPEVKEKYRRYVQGVRDKER